MWPYRRPSPFLPAIATHVQHRSQPPLIGKLIPSIIPSITQYEICVLPSVLQRKHAIVSTIALSSRSAQNLSIELRIWESSSLSQRTSWNVSHLTVLQ